MSRRVFIGVFENEEDTMSAVSASRAKGLTVVDVFAPYAIHEMDKAMGLEPSKLPWVCLALGLAGATLKVWFEFWTTAVDWPLNVGGKPWNSLPAFVPVTFEVMVLFAGVSTVIALFIAAQLWPWKRPSLPVPRVTDDRFAVVLEEIDATFDKNEVTRMFEDFNVLQTEERAESEQEVR
jgi:hypothetical protein